MAAIAIRVPRFLISVPETRRARQIAIAAINPDLTVKNHAKATFATRQKVMPVRHKCDLHL